MPNFMGAELLGASSPSFLFPPIGLAVLLEGLDVGADAEGCPNENIGEAPDLGTPKENVGLLLSAGVVHTGTSAGLTSKEVVLLAEVVLVMVKTGVALSADVLGVVVFGAFSAPDGGLVEGTPNVNPDAGITGLLSPNLKPVELLTFGLSACFVSLSLGMPKENDDVEDPLSLAAGIPKLNFEFCFGLGGPLSVPGFLQEQATHFKSAALFVTIQSLHDQDPSGFLN